MNKEILEKYKKAKNIIQNSEYSKAVIKHYELYKQYKQYEYVTKGGMLKFDVDIKMFDPKKTNLENLNYIYANVKINT